MWYFSIEIAIDVRVLLGSAHIEQHNIISCCLDFDVSTYITLSFGTDFILFLAKKISFDKKIHFFCFYLHKVCRSMDQDSTISDAGETW